MATTQPIPSPITGKSATRVCDKIHVHDIIDLYRKDNIDVNEYFRGLQEISILECTETKYRFFYPHSVAGESSFYDQLYSKRNPENEDFYRKWGHDFQFAYDRIQPGEKILDIGCGTGEFLKKIVHKTADAYGLELNTKSFEYAKASGLNVFKETIQEFSERNKQAFDVVCIFQVLEHVYDVKSFLESALKVLKKGGKLIIGVPNSEPYQRQYDKYITWNLPPHHVGLWNRVVFERIQSVFNIRLKEVQYDERGNRWVVDAYLRARMWLDIKTDLANHSLAEKLKLSLLTPVAAPFSYYKFIKKGINGSFIVVQYEKL